MPIQSRFSLLVCRCFVVISVGRERDFRIDHHIAPVGKVENHIGNKAATAFFVGDHATGFVFHSPLLVELHSSLESHVLQKGAESEFSEVSLCFVLSGECRREAIGSFSHESGLRQGSFDAFIESSHGIEVVPIGLLHSIAHFLYAIAQRPEDAVELSRIFFAQLGSPFSHLALAFGFEAFGHEFQPPITFFSLLSRF